MIFISETFIEDYLKQLLQKKIKFRLNDRIWRSGRLLLFKQSGFFIELLLKTSKKERFEIPIPFDIILNRDKTVLVFDYRFSTLVYGQKELLEIIDQLNIEKKNRFYNTILYIEIEEECI